MRLVGASSRKLLSVSVLVAGLALGLAGITALAQVSGERGSPEALIGVAVFSAEGKEVGTVSAVSVGEDGHISEIRMTTASPLGLGVRTVAVPEGRFVALDGAVVLDMSASEVDALPTGKAERRGTSA